MSQAKNKFLEQLAPLGFDEAYLDYAYVEIMRLGATFYPQTQVIHFDESSKVFYELQLHRHEKKQPYLSSFTATHRTVPEIAHGIFIGVDTETLETRMKQVDWRQGVIRRDSQANYPVSELKEQWKLMEQLKQSGNKEAIDIAQHLQMKYWAGSWAQDYVLLDLYTNRFDLPYSFDLKHEYSPVSAKDAYNLLSGRPMLRTGNSNGPNIGYWFGLQRQTEPDPYKLLTGKAYPEFDLSSKIRELPVIDPLSARKVNALQASLEKGLLLDFNATDFGVEIPIQISVNAKDQDLAIYTEKSQIIQMDELRYLLAKNRGVKQFARKRPGRGKGL